MMTAQPIIFNPPFNFSIATLGKINDYMKDCDKHLKNRQIMEYTAALEVEYKNIGPFLNKDQAHKAARLWAEIQKRPLIIKEDYIEYADDLPSLLRELDFYLILCLHKNNISYSSRELTKGIEAQYKKYDITNND
jgi:hypothetical protein